MKKISLKIISMGTRMRKRFIAMRKGLFLLFCLALCFLFFTNQPKTKYYLSIGAIFRNEARFLKEWIEYHSMMGVEHFYLFNNLSEDQYREVLNPYIEKGVVELIDWPYQGKNHKEWNKIQCAAYSDLIKNKGSETFWLAIIDTDEFILPIEKKNLVLFLKDYEGYSGIGINWQLYGTSGVKQIAKDKTLIGSLTKKAPQDFQNNKFVKSIIQPQKVKKITQPHFCRYKKPYFHVTENKVPFPKKSLTPTVSINKIRINHYTYRDEDFFYGEKRRRFLDWFPYATPPEVNPELSVVEDPAILPHVPELEKRLY